VCVYVCGCLLPNSVESCFHCTYGTYRAMLDGLHAAYPEDVFALIDYPTEIDGIALHEYMHVLSRASPWKSVDYLKDCLRRCSRDMKWKMDVALELELLAEREHERFTTARQQLSDEIDDVRAQRVSFVWRACPDAEPTLAWISS
jgi:hypothetical protein